MGRFNEREQAINRQFAAWRAPGHTDFTVEKHETPILARLPRNLDARNILATSESHRWKNPTDLETEDDLDLKRTMEEAPFAVQDEDVARTLSDTAADCMQSCCDADKSCTQEYLADQPDSHIRIRTPDQLRKAGYIRKK